jgi:NAD(P)-dependent dehydrogenase (short-subunit alcohol dehydrogenase family)
MSNPDAVPPVANGSTSAPGRLCEQVAIITGAGRGIGRALAVAFAAEGASVTIADIDFASATQVAREIVSAGGRAIAVRTDISDADAVGAMADATTREFGRINILVNNAAAMADLPRRAFDEIPVDEFDRVLEVNVRGTWLCCRAVVGAMREAGGGRIVNIASDMVLSGAPGLLHYVASKGAIVAMTRSLAREVGHLGITVNTVAPGFTLTDAALRNGAEVAAARISGRAIPRAEMPDDVIGAVVFMASPDAAFVTGQLLAVNGGYTMT